MKFFTMMAIAMSLFGSLTWATSEDSQYQTSRQVKNEMVKRLSELLAVPGLPFSLQEKLRLIADQQPIFDPRLENYSDRQLGDTMTLPKRLEELAQSMVDGIKKAHSATAPEDAQKAAAESLRALIEAYLTIGLTTGNHQMTLRAESSLGLVGTLLSPMAFAIATTFGDVSPSSTSTIFMALASGLSFLSYLRAEILILKVDKEAPDKVLKKPAAQPILLPNFMRTRMLRSEANTALRLFWGFVSIFVMHSVDGQALPRIVTQRYFAYRCVEAVMFALPRHVNVRECEKWSIEELVRVSRATREDLVLRSCQDHLL